MTFLKNLFSSRRWFALAVLSIICLSALLILFAPQQVSVVHYKLTLVLLAGLVLFLLDYVLFPFASPDSYLADDWRKTPDSDRPDDADYPVVEGYRQVFCFAMLRRAIIIGCGMLAVGLGL